MDKEIRLGRFDKWGYKNSFSKGELARELTYTNRDYDKLEQQCKKQQEIISRAIELLNNPWSFESGNKEVDEIIYNKKRKVIDILKEVSK